MKYSQDEPPGKKSRLSLFANTISAIEEEEVCESKSGEEKNIVG